MEAGRRLASPSPLRPHGQSGEGSRPGQPDARQSSTGNAPAPRDEMGGRSFGGGAPPPPAQQQPQRQQQMLDPRRAVTFSRPVAEVARVEMDRPVAEAATNTQARKEHSKGYWQRRRQDSQAQKGKGKGKGKSRGKR